MLSMRQSYRMIPVYTADVSGVCSALYELGGMTVMHDPSGCNSTYNTHDEIRWYDQDSLIFISGLTEIDAIMGNDRKFIDDIEYAARELHPKFISLAVSPWELIATIVLFVLIYLVLFIAWARIVARFIKQGPTQEQPAPVAASSISFMSGTPPAKAADASANDETAPAAKKEGE